MPKNNYDKGLCDFCKGFIQYDKVSDSMYCLGCHKTWEPSEWEWLKEENKEKEYHENTDIEILTRLNNL